ncbi:MAG: hypothetical protein H0X51_05650 [Parachlamydiaceae bacterium]|nr:hypothetical protein [Parachlamydiaceae bacterium]
MDAQIYLNTWQIQMTDPDAIAKILHSREKKVFGQKPFSTEAEGGCGVIGMACAEKVPGKHLLPALCNMRNRGNGKGGGIAASGLSPAYFGVTQEIIDSHYMLAIAYLDSSCQAKLERDFIYSTFDVAHIHKMGHRPNATLDDDFPIVPPDVTIYFVQVKPTALTFFQQQHQLHAISPHAIEDEVVYQNSQKLNQTFYSSTGDKHAFVLSHGKNLLVLKLVGYGDDVITYYQLEEFPAHVWIGHHRYPTKGRVWHPGGAHPFVGLNEALVHNGDFANYFSICEYLAQRNIHPLFLTDTEVAALLFDLLHRTYNYPLEYVIEALAPTTERDFTLLPAEKQKIYSMLQKTHMNGSPDGPWFFIVAQSLTQPQPLYRLIGITDTSMLRPQVFALQNGSAPIGFAASEKQAIDATLDSLSKSDDRFWSCADYYWNARGGSHTDGGAFSFTVYPTNDGKAQLLCTDKFNRPIHPIASRPANFPIKNSSEQVPLPNLPEEDFIAWTLSQLHTNTFEQATCLIKEIAKIAHAIPTLTFLLDQHYPLKYIRRSCLIAFLNSTLVQLFANLTYPHIIDATSYPIDGPDSLARHIVQLVKKGHNNLIIYNCQGHRFIGNGLGPNSHEVTIDVYGASGDYLASGIDGATIRVHGSTQDQVAQIFNAGTLVIYGDVGQTFLYGAKGGKVFVRGNAAGRPLINAVGSPKVVINGTCLDYLAESFMAGNPLNDGGFAILNGIAFDDNHEIIDLPTPYPGNNLLSLASGGAIYIRDPLQKVALNQLHGGKFTDMTTHDWDLILPYLKENEKLFKIPVSRLINSDSAYRKVVPN